MKKKIFRSPAKYFHVNIDFETHPLFRELDWIFVQKKVQEHLNTNEISLHALVMMDSHLHLLIESHHHAENFFCEDLKAKLYPGKTSTTDCHCEPVNSYPQYINTYKYIFRNPVEAGLAESVEQYPYSSLRSILGQSVAYCEVVDYLGLIHNPVHLLNWLNEKVEFRFSKLDEFIVHARPFRDG